MTSAALQLPNNNPRDYEGLPEELRQEYAKMLNLYSTDDFYSAIWHIHLNKANRAGNIRFPQAQTLLESDITRIAVIITLTSGTAIATCQRRVHDFNTIFNFFASENLNLHYITQNSIDNFIKYLDSSPYDAWKRNQYMQSLQVLTESLTTFDVIHIPSNLDATYRFPQQREPKRAPDTITINQLDSFSLTIRLIFLSPIVLYTFSCGYIRIAFLKLLPHRSTASVILMIMCLPLPFLILRKRHSTYPIIKNTISCLPASAADSAMILYINSNNTQLTCNRAFPTR